MKWWLPTCSRRKSKESIYKRFRLATRKELYPSNHFHTFVLFDRTALPSISAFYNELTLSRLRGLKNPQRHKCLGNSKNRKKSKETTTNLQRIQILKEYIFSFQNALFRWITYGWLSKGWWLPICFRWKSRAYMINCFNWSQGKKCTLMIILIRLLDLIRPLYLQKQHFTFLM